MHLSGTHFTMLCQAAAPLRAASCENLGGVSGIWRGQSEATREIRSALTMLRISKYERESYPPNPANPAPRSPGVFGLLLNGVPILARPVTMARGAARLSARDRFEIAPLELRPECRRTARQSSGVPLCAVAKLEKHR